MRVATKETRAKGKRQSKSAIAVAEADRTLFEALRALRLRLAAEAKLPPYIICTDVTLAELASVRPADTEALHGITGLGNSKITRYGAALLATIAAHGRDDATPDNGLSQAANQTLALHRKGLDADKIAASAAARRRRRLRPLRRGDRAGRHRGARRAGRSMSRTSTRSSRRSSASARWKAASSAPPHAALDGRFDYGILKCLLAELS